nr:(2Fe-2S)-binding protein [uncultured Ferrovibrio sp.]
MTEITFTLNGETVRRSVPVRKNLVDFLRQDMGLTGSHVGCEHGVCGACTLLVDRRAVRGCLMLAAQIDGLSVQTVEGLAQDEAVNDLLEAFVARNALQCGFCTPGMLATAVELLRNPRPMSRAEIREQISGNYCRCTGYEAIVDAIGTVLDTRLANMQADGEVA